MATLKNTLIDDTGYLQLPSGTTAQRPLSPSAGYTRWNTTEGYMEIYDGTDWKGVSTAASTFNVEYLLVGGGASGGNNHGGGGGAGGYISSSLSSVISGSTFTVTVGAGGAAATTGGQAGYAGGTSQVAADIITTISAIGGGGGGGRITTGQTNPGQNGASGGGGAGTNPTTAGSGTSGQGFNGGIGSSNSTAGNGGGGGGAAEVGEAASGVVNTGKGGDGGDGKASSITGTSTYYAGGGGGGRWSTGIVGTGGLGGGGDGGALTSANEFPTAGEANTGAGGGGGGDGVGSGAAGGSGVAIFAYDTGSANAAGGIVGDAGNGRKYHQFNTSGTFKVGSTSDFTIDTTNLTGWWDAADYSSRGDTTWTDKMGNYNLTKGGTPTLGNNPYYTFQANGEYYNTGLTLTNGAKAMVLWIKYTGAGGDGYSLSGWQEGSAYCYLGRQDSNGKYYYYIGSSTGGAAATGPTTNVWYMLTLTNNSSGDFEFYENDGSTVIASGTGINMGSNGTSRFNIGSVNNVGGHRNHAQIGMCFYYTKYLSNSDVANLYNATKTNFV